MKRLFKNTKLMLGLAATLFIVGAVFITKGIIDSNRLEPGWETLAYTKIETSDGDEVYPFDYDIQLHYYFSTRDQEKREQMVAIETLLNESIRDISILTDSINLYEDTHGVVKNLAYLNQHFNEPVVLNPQLYTMLKQAVLASIESGGVYHIFAGELKSFWDHQFLSSQPSSTDPQHDESTSALLNSINEALTAQSALSNLGFSWDDNNYTVTISTSVAHQNYLRLDFQYLRFAFGIEYLHAELTEENYHGGYLTSNSGYLSILGPNPEYSNGKWYLNVANPSNSQNSAAIIEFADVSQIRSVMLTDMTAYSYTIRSDFSLPINIRRHPFYSSLTGYPSNYFRSLAILSETSSMVDMTIEAMILFHQSVEDTANDLETYRNHSNVYFALYNNGNPIESDNLEMLVANDGSYPLILDDSIVSQIVS